MTHQDQGKHLILQISVLRIVLALTSFSFFVYFFHTEYNGLVVNQWSLDRYRLEQGYHRFIDTFYAEQAAVMSYLVGVGDASKIASRFNRTDARWAGVLAAAKEPQSYIKISHNTNMHLLNQTRKAAMNGTLSAPETLKFYNELTEQIFVVWTDTCMCSIDSVNRYQFADLYRVATNIAFMNERDLSLYILLNNLTQSTINSLKSTIYKYRPLQYLHYQNLKLSGSPTLLEYFHLIEHSSSNTLSWNYINSIRTIIDLPSQQLKRYISNNYMMGDYPVFDNITYAQKWDLVINNVEKGDETIGDPIDVGLWLSFYLAAIGMGLQVIVTVNLLWIAVPTVISLYFTSAEGTKSPIDTGTGTGNTGGSVIVGIAP